MFEHNSQTANERIHITLDVKNNGAEAKREIPLRVLLLGELFCSTGKKSSDANATVYHARESSLNDLMKFLQPKIELELPSSAQLGARKLCLGFESLRDFHPDNLVKKVPHLQRLFAMRNLLRDLRGHLLDEPKLRAKLQAIMSDRKAAEKIKSQFADFLEIKNQ